MLTKEMNEKKASFKTELQEMIDRGILRAMRVGESRRLHARPCKERVERLLYARRGLDILISSLEEELSEEAAIAPPPSSMAYAKTDGKVIHLLPSGEALGLPWKKEDAEALLLRNRRAARRIDRAVATLSDDPYYRLLTLKYHDGLSEEAIAEVLSCDPSTIRRNKNRLLERLSIIFFGVDALESI